MKRVLPWVCLLLTLALAGPAQAQTAPVNDDSKGFFRALLGGTMGGGSGGAAFGATIGLKTGQKGVVFGEFGQMTNVLPDQVIDDLDTNAAFVALPLGGKTSTSAQAKATYGLVGMRLNAFRIGDGQIFVEVGGGAAHVTSTYNAQIRGSEELQGDITNLVSSPFTSSTPTTKAMADVGVGLILGLTRTTGIEMGYRYIHIFTDNPAIKTGNIYGAYRVGF